MAKTSTPSVDCLIAIQQMLDASEPAASRGPDLNAQNQVLRNQHIDPIDQGSATLQDRARYALQVLGLLELRCKISLRIAASLVHIQRRVRTGANLASLVAAAVVIGALAFGQPSVAIIAAILATLAIGVGMESEYMVVTRRAARFGPQAAHERLSQIVAQVQIVRIELQILLRYDLAVTGLGGAICNADALCAQIMNEDVALITDPDGRVSDDSPIPVPLQA